MISGSGTRKTWSRATTSAPTASGANDLANGIDGVDFTGGSTYNTIGGTTAGARDVISGDSYNAVLLSDPSTSIQLDRGGLDRHQRGRRRVRV